ncbi:MAG: DUF4382 domain-containing protein, partial [Merismopedia sp. SIO2A8]|nr:DUF4382 domain-containing protein [Merismopedia sp. SIO2A8]
VTNEDDINSGALGFDPLAALAQDNVLTVDLTSLETTLSPDHLAQLHDAIDGLGQVGEGHCAIPTL